MMLLRLRSSSWTGIEPRLTGFYRERGGGILPMTTTQLSFTCTLLGETPEMYREDGPHRRLLSKIMFEDFFLLVVGLYTAPGSEIVARSEGYRSEKFLSCAQ